MNLKEYQKNLDKLLVYNVNFNKIEEVRDLIQRGANVDAKNEEGVPVLALAAEKGQMAITSLLVHEGANLLETDAQGLSVYSRLMKKTAQSMIKPNVPDAIFYMMALYFKNVFEGQNRYNGKRKKELPNEFIENVIQSRENRFLAVRVGDRERS